VDADVGEDEKENDERAGEDDGVDRGAIARVETSEPCGDEVVPAGGHGEAGDSGEDEAGGADETKLQEQDGDHGDEIAEAAVAESIAQGLGDGGDEVDVATRESDDGAGAEDEHRADDGRGEDDGSADGVDGVLAFAGEDGDVLETAEGAEDHLAEEGERDHVELRELQGKRLVVDVHVSRERPEGQQDERGVDDEDGDAADVMNPFAEFETADGGSGDGDGDAGGDGEGGDVVFGQPRGGGADEVGEFGGDGVEDGGGDGDAVEPEVPRGHKAASVAECGAGPDVEAAFEGHLVVEVDDGDRHREVEDDHGGDPGDGLGAAKPGGDADPAATDDTEDLREDEVAEAEPAVKTGLWSGRSREHVLGMVAQSGETSIIFLRPPSPLSSCPIQALSIRLQGMRKISLSSTGMAAGIFAIAMSCGVAGAQMGEMQGMHHHDAPAAGERLGSVSFPVSCEASSKVPMERGIALLHSFGYEEAGEQFTALTKSDPGCAMAYWGVAMSGFHELWEQPNKAAMDQGWAAMQQAQKLGGKTDRERKYIAALSSFYDPAKVNYQARVDAYTAGMLALHEAYPADVEASAFYALSLIADVAPDDTSLVKERKALEVLVPLFEQNPDHPGLAHYIIHTCDTPALAQQGLTAAQKYAQIASSSPHALHMPGHIFARLGMWPEDIDSNLASVAASEKAEAAGMPGAHHQFHADEFLLYAYLQIGDDGKAKKLVEGIGPLADRLDAMPGMDDMKDMSGYARNEFPAIYDLEMRNWLAASVLKVYPTTPGIYTADTIWARGIANGRLKRAKEAAEDLAQFDALLDAYKKTRPGVPTPGLEIYRNEMLAWQQFAEGKNETALSTMRKAADEQDKLGQGEVDLPTREMLGDMLMELKRPKDALVEYKVALMLSPNRLNGLYGAGRAAEAFGMKKEAGEYYAAMLKNTDDGAHSTRPSLTHAREFLAGKVSAAE